jgi:flagellar FliL protein
MDRSMSDEDRKPKRKKGKRILLIGGMLLLVTGGGAGAALYARDAGLFRGGHAPDLPRLVLRDGVPRSEAARYFSPTGDKRPDPSKFQPTYFPIPESFTANLRDDSGFVQASVGVSTYYDERVIANLERHQMAVRSAILLALTDQDAATLSTTRGKEVLKGELRTAVNDVLKAKEGFGGIDDVYFTSFVIQ